MPNETNPVIVQAISASAIIGALKTLIAFAVAFQWLELDESRNKALIDVIETIVPIAAVLIGAWWASRKVTPLSNPKDIDNVPLTRPDNSPAITQLENIQSAAIKINEKIDQATDERRIQRENLAEKGTQ